MWTYDTNQMGPMKHWYEKHKIPFEIKIIDNKEYKIHKTYYSGGRIDCYCDNENDPDYSKYTVDIDIPVMEDDSWVEFSNWLENVETENLVDFKYLKEKYEKETNNKLKIWKDNKIKLFSSKEVNKLCWSHFCKFLSSKGDIDEETGNPLFSCNLQKEFNIKLPSNNQKTCKYKRTTIKGSMDLKIKMRKEKIKKEGKENV